ANITAAATTRATADTTLTNRIAAEENARAAAVTAEATTRAAADTTLQANITAEATTRATADTTLTNRIAAEENARAAADTALGNRITNETRDRILADDLLRDQIASSTATAIALGGNTILPDTNFTISGNMGFYRGAQAVAVNVAGRVAPNTYVTGAVGGGLNKSGKVGGRVGVVFGF
ncbi:MAG: hypothetical protein ACKOEC_18350, partial [Acidimicrobiia bacterium]